MSDALHTVVVKLFVMPSLLRSAAWRCRLLRPGNRSRRGLSDLRLLCDFGHVVYAETGVVHIFVYRVGKLVHSTLVAGVAGVRWRPVAGPAGSESMWDLRGRHEVWGVEPDPGVRLDPAVAGRLLDARALLAGDRESLVNGGLRVVELWAGRGRVSQAVAAAGGRAVRVGYRWGQDFSRAAVRSDVDDLVDAAPGATVLCAPQCRDYCSYAEYNASWNLAFAFALRRRRLRQVVILRWLCGLLLRHLERGGDLVLEQPRSSRMWRLFCLRRLIRLARSRGRQLFFVDLDQCAFGLADPKSGRPYRTATRFLVSDARLASLSRKCVCRRRHQQLKGSTVYRGCVVRRTRFAECYPRELAKAFAGVLSGR